MSSDETLMKTTFKLENWGKLFYIVSPNSTTFHEIDEVPHYFSEIFPLFFGLVFAEYIALAFKNETPRLTESINSLAHGILTETFKILFIGLEIALYVYVHEHYKIFDLKWDHPITWYVTVIGVDFAYYWAHRASHEVNVLWAVHQVHHSSEDFNMAVAVRHPIPQHWVNTIFYLPLALILPPAHCLAHQQLNLLYQGWIHSSIIGNLGPLEYILNTPTHHKVHHGCNLYVLDKNYGGLLIIWDRIFGTFQNIKPDEELVYGIVFQHRSHNPFWQMYFPWPYLKKWCGMQGSVGDKFKSLFYGPSWLPGAPRLGRDEDKIDIKPREKFRVVHPLWLQAYVLIHFFATCLIFQELALTKGGLTQLKIFLTLTYLFASLTSVGFLSEGHQCAPYFEILRCIFFALVSDRYTTTLISALRLYFVASLAIWVGVLLLGIQAGQPIPPGGEKLQISQDYKNSDESSLPNGQNNFTDTYKSKPALLIRQQKIKGS